MTLKIMQNIYDTDYYDNLTRLPNLQQFRLLSREIIDSQAMRSQGMAFVYFSLKDFGNSRKHGLKQNDDWILEMVSQAIQSTFQGRIVARLSRNHFAVITTNDGLPERLEDIYGDIRVLRRDVTTELKTGIYILDPSDDDADRALDKARIACQSIVDKADEHFIYYDSKLDTQSQLQSYIREHLLSAIDEERIIPYYQPIVEPLTGNVCCYEVCPRWDDPVYGTLEPEEFSNILEENHLIQELELALIRQVCGNYNLMKEQGLPLFPVVLKLSKVDFILTDIVEEIDQLLGNMNVPRGYLSIEIEEEAFSGDSEYVIGDAVNRLRRLGFRVWMEDFGSGYSSLYNLGRYTLDVLKVDESFVSGLKKGSQQEAVLSSIIRMAEVLHLQTVIQGVDTEETCGILKNIGFDMEQGSCFGQPVPIEKLILN